MVEMPTLEQPTDSSNKKSKSAEKVSKTGIIRQYNIQAWQSLQFAAFRHLKVGQNRHSGLVSDTVDDQNDGTVISNFLDQLDNCLRFISAAEWDQRRK